MRVCSRVALILCAWYKVCGWLMRTKECLVSGVRKGERPSSPPFPSSPSFLPLLWFSKPPSLPTTSNTLRADKETKGSSHGCCGQYWPNIQAHSPYRPDRSCYGSHRPLDPWQHIPLQHSAMITFHPQTKAQEDISLIF